MPEPNWNPDQAGAEMADLFRQADAILSKPIYQAQGSAPATNQDAASDQTTEEQSQGLHSS
jgi:hypothetical protein